MDSTWAVAVGTGAAVLTALAALAGVRSAKLQDEEGWDWLRLWAESVDDRLDSLSGRLDRHLEDRRS